MTFSHGFGVLGLWVGVLAMVLAFRAVFGVLFYANLHNMLLVLTGLVTQEFEKTFRPGHV